MVWRGSCGCQGRRSPSREKEGKGRAQSCDWPIWGCAIERKPGGKDRGSLHTYVLKYFYFRYLYFYLYFYFYFYSCCKRDRRESHGEGPQYLHTLYLRVCIHTHIEYLLMYADIRENCLCVCSMYVSAKIHLQAPIMRSSVSPCSPSRAGVFRSPFQSQAFLHRAA